MITGFTTASDLEISSGRAQCCELTPSVPAAIATIAVRGANSLEIVHQLLATKRAGALAIDAIRFGRWNPDAGLAGEQVVVCRVSDEQVEIHAHGGAAVCERILEDLAQAGCEVVLPSQWPTAATGIAESQAERDLERATTVKVGAVLLDQVRGALSEALRSIVAALRAAEANRATQLIDELLSWSEFGRMIVRPPRVCLAGPPNVGKSSLMNAILGIRRAIVHHEPGTTRDWLDAVAVIDGWPIEFIDTAGIRDSDQPIERAGIELAIEKLEQSDLAAFVVDATVGWTQTHERLLRSFAGRSIVAWNKCDLPSVERPSTRLAIVSTNAISTAGVDSLRETIVGNVFDRIPLPGQAIPFRSEQVVALTEARKLIRSDQLLEAVEILNRCYSRHPGCDYRD